ncbi:MAG: hypothetical protein JSS98_13365 [Bacteroidetes bacterium]|nr:hypothetical protein [Bacteroidota bacterium]
MGRSIHISFTKSVFAITFLFLNTICIASPSLKIQAENNIQSSPLLPEHDVNNSALPESKFDAETIACTTVQRSGMVLNHSSIERVDFNTGEGCMQNISSFNIRPYYNLPIPGYYLLLFRCTLF